jgi:integrase
MTVFFNKARSRWQYDFMIEGVRHAGQARDPDTGQPARNRTEAKRIEDALRVAARSSAQAAAAVPAPGTYTLAQAIGAWATRKRGADNWVNNQVYAREILRHFGPATPVAAIDEAAVWGYVAWSRDQQVRIWAGGNRKPTPDDADDATLWRLTDRRRSDSTINRYLNVIREALRLAHEARDGHGRRLLAVPVTVPELSEPVTVPRPIPDADLERIAAVAAPHLADAITLARNMGFRLDELTTIRPDQVDESARGVWLDAGQTKANRATFKPANAAAWAVLVRRKIEAEQLGMGRILYWAKPAGRGRVEWRTIRTFKTAWMAALRRAGLTGRYTWHNTKASFVTAIGAVASARVTRDLAEHRDASTTDRYLAVMDEAKRTAVEAVSWAPCGPVPNPVSQSGTGRRVRVRAKYLKEMVGPARFELATPRPPERCVAPEVADFLAFARKKRA